MSNAYISGITSSSDFPTLNAFQSVASGQSNGFVAKISAADAAAVSLHPAVVNFGTALVGSTSASETITLSDMGTAPLTVSQIAITGTNGGDFSQANNCGNSVAGGASCAITVKFAPTATGTRTATITVTDSAPGSPHMASLSGTGAIEPVASMSPANLDFENQEATATSAAQTVTLQNTGNAAMSISSIVASTNFGQTNNCGTSLAVGAACKISVTFTPPSADVFFGTLTITNNATNSPQTVNLRGSSNSGPAALSPSSLTFGNQLVGTTSAPQTVILTNNGTAPMTIQAFTIQNGYYTSTDFAETNNCLGPSATLAVNASCTINVSFTPTAGGTRIATLGVFDSASNNGQWTSLTGTGTSPGGGTIAIVTRASVAFHSSMNTASTIKSNAFLVPAGDLVVAYCGASTSASQTPAISDTAANSFVQIGPTAAGSGGDALAMFYAANAKGTTSDWVTCSWPSAHHNLAVIAVVYKGVAATSPLDQSASGTARGGSSITTSPVFSTTSPNEIAVAGMMSGSGCIAPPTPGSGYTMELDPVPTGCSGPVAAVEDEIFPTAQTATASIGFATATWADMIAATFRAAPAPGTISIASKSYGAFHDSVATASNISSNAFVLPAGGLLVAYCGASTSTSQTPIISDAAGNTFIQIATSSISGGDSLAMFYAAKAKGSTSETVTCNWPSAHHSVAVMALAYSGADPNAPLDVVTSGAVAGGTSVPINSGGGRTNFANEVAVAGFMASGCSPAPTAGSGYAWELEAGASGCVGPLAGAEDEPVPVQGMWVQPSISFVSEAYADIIVATFKPAP